MPEKVESKEGLTQDAIDALLTAPQAAKDEAQADDGAGTGPETREEAPVPAVETDSAPRPAPRAQVVVNAPPPPGATPPPGVIHATYGPERLPVDEERAAAIAASAAGAAVSPLQDNITAISSRVDALEAALKKIESLEKEVARLKAQKPQEGAVTADAARAIAERVVKLEKAAKGSPVFNLYEKFTCASCESQGAAQVRIRCGSCGKEGWFGRSSKAA